jgi:hypothetical protein
VKNHVPYLDPVGFVIACSWFCIAGEAWHVVAQSVFGLVGLIVVEDTNLNGLPAVPCPEAGLWQPPTVLAEFELSQERFALTLVPYLNVPILPWPTAVYCSKFTVALVPLP